MHRLAAKALFDSQLAAIPASLIEFRGWILHCMEFPLLDCEFTHAAVLPLRLRFHCIGWNTEPPSIELLMPDGKDLLKVPGTSTSVFNGSAHPTTSKPFICMRGSREYHTHPGHSADLWEPLRNKSDMSLGGILTQIWNAWRKEVK